MLKVSKYRIISDPYFPVFSPNTGNTEQKKLPKFIIKDAKFFVLIVSCLRTHQQKKFYNEQLLLNSSAQWYHITECDVISPSCHNWLACNWLASVLAIAYHFGSFFIMFSSPCRTIASFSLGHRRHRLELWLYFL